MSKKMGKAFENINIVLSWIFLWITIVLGTGLHAWTVLRLALHSTIWKAILALFTPIASELVVVFKDIQDANGVLQGPYATTVVIFFIILALALITRILKDDSKVKTQSKKSQEKK